MNVTQRDSRTIRVKPASGAPFLVPYRFFWNGHLRQAESIRLVSPASARGSAEVHGFFLFGEIRDRISEDAAGIAIERTWSVKSHGAVRLSFDIQMDADTDVRWLFPGVHAGRGWPQSAVSFLGEKTAYPGALFLSLDREGVLLFSPSPDCGGTPSAIGIHPPEEGDESTLPCVSLRFPGVEEPAARIGPVPEHRAPPAEEVLESTGSLERTHVLYLAFAPAQRIQVQAAASVLERLAALPKKQPAAPTVDPAALGVALQASLPTHLVQQGGVAGVRELPGSLWLSSSAGLGLAIALRRLFPGDADLSELGLRLADFSLKGQLASGFFHESYRLDTARWCGVRGEAKATLLSLGQSSRIAELLLLLAEDLAAVGLPGEKYFLAGLRFVEFFLDEKARLAMPGGLHLPGSRDPVRDPGQSLAGLPLFFPLARVHARTGKDRHKKALDSLVRRFSALPWDSFAPPGSREQRGPDSAGALLAVRLFVEMRRHGYKPAQPPVSGATAARALTAESTRLFASLLLPWIRVHADAAPGVAPQGDRLSGCLLDSFVRQRLLFAGNETAYLLLRLREESADDGNRSVLARLARWCLDAAAAAPLGASFLQHTRWDSQGKPEQGRGRLGPVDARRLATEIEAGLRIAQEFPRL